MVYLNLALITTILLGLPLESPVWKLVLSRMYDVTHSIDVFKTCLRSLYSILHITILEN